MSDVVMRLFVVCFVVVEDFEFGVLLGFFCLGEVKMEILGIVKVYSFFVIYEFWFCYLSLMVGEYFKCLGE